MQTVDKPLAQDRAWTVGTRRSALATTQTRQTLDRLAAVRRDAVFAVQEIVTKGDRILDVPLAKVGGKGLFISELEAALLEGRIDFAVHSMKDVPADVADGLVLAAVPAREDARDVLVSRAGHTLESLPQHATVGTSSLRRAAQLLRLRPDLRVEALRGNIDTRLGRLSGLDAIVLAAAGLSRMGWWEGGEALVGESQARVVALPADVMIPAAGQGALALECRAADERSRALLGLLHDGGTAACVTAERAFLRAVGGSCQVPVGAYAVLSDDGLGVRLTAFLGAPDGTEIVRGDSVGGDPDAVGRRLALELLEQGGGQWQERWGGGRG